MDCGKRVGSGLALGLVLVLVAGVARADDDSLREGPVAVAAGEVGVGVRVEDFSFMDLEGKAGRLSDYRDAKAVVVCVTSVTCPVSRKYGATLVALARDYQAKGVVFIGLNVGEAEPLDKMKEALAAAREAGFTVRYVADRAVGRLLGVRSTTEVLVIDRARTVVYRGAVDDQFGLGYSLAEPRKRYLVEALEAVLADERPTVEATTAPGCVVSLGEMGSKSGGSVTYHNRISRIVQNRCVECHRAGENGPFTLTSYADVKGNAAMIKKVVSKGTMPPWFAKGGAGTFHNDRSLSAGEREDLIAWIDGGCVEGDAADGPVARAWVEGWRIGRPDVVFESAEAKQIPANGVMRYQYVMIRTKLKEDKWVWAMEVRPSAPQVVHHMLVFVELPREDPRRRQFRGHGGGLKGYFAGMVPGQGHIVFGEGTAKLLPKGATLVFQIHYTPNGEAAVDRPRIGFKFAKEKPRHEVVTGAASNRFFVIPPGAENHKIMATHFFAGATRLLSVNPHAHVRGKAFKYELFYPDGTSRVILDVPRYDFNWQIEYQFARPMDVPAGTRLVVSGWYDNSEKNPANPDAGKEVRFGEQTWEEMMIGYFTGHLLN